LSVVEATNAASHTPTRQRGPTPFANSSKNPTRTSPRSFGVSVNVTGLAPPTGGSPGCTHNASTVTDAE
jgi:hypothetical protein